VLHLLELNLVLDLSYLLLVVYLWYLSLELRGCDDPSECLLNLERLDWQLILLRQYVDWN
jgi:hypothetical protein